MSIFVKEVDSFLLAEDGVTLATQQLMYVMVEGNEDVAAFKKLIQAGSDLNPNLRPAMKELADLVTNGAVLQNYQGGNK